MYDNDSRGISYTAGFFMIIAFAIGGLMLASAMSVLIWHQMTGKSFTELQKGLSDPANSDVMKIIQSVTAVVGFFIPTVIAATLLSKRPVKLLGFSSAGIKLNQVVLAVLLVGSALLVSSSLSYFTNNVPIPEAWKIRFDKMELEYNTQVSAIISLKNTRDYILALVIMAFLPALCEETLFRGGLQNFLTRATNRPWLSIAVVSILFSLAHFSFYGFLSRFFLGMVLGALFYYSGKLWLSIVAHFINNALAITMLYIATQEGKPLKEAIKQDVTSYWGMLAIPLVIVLFVAFKRASVRQPAV
ncbi:MAG TPA: CPBP family intramembrane glutamic endopeptidase [Chitinophagaceae bacterium]|nr:CPBP family intramembrane glutamic endopeptidase [Chitinophagaceae bacterium]